MCDKSHIDSIPFYAAFFDRRLLAAAAVAVVVAVVVVVVVRYATIDSLSSLDRESIIRMIDSNVMGAASTATASTATFLVLAPIIGAVLSLFKSW